MSDPQARALVALPGWTWAQGLPWIRYRASPMEHIRGYARLFGEPYPGAVIDLDHPSACGHLWAMLGPGWIATTTDTDLAVVYSGSMLAEHDGPNLGRACAAALIARGYCGSKP